MRLSELQKSKFMKRGEIAYKGMQGHIAAHGGEVVEIRSLDDAGYASKFREPESLGLDEELLANLKESGHPSEDYVFTEVSANSSAGELTCDPAYQNYIHMTGEVIVCTNNDVNRDSLKGTPGQIFWSDVMASVFHGVVSSNGGSTKDLRRIVRAPIANDDTRLVLNYICSRRGENALELRMDNADDAELFFLLLGTVHRTGPARMLGKYPQMFGRKTIAGVQILNDTGPAIS